MNYVVVGKCRDGKSMKSGLLYECISELEAHDKARKVRHEGGLARVFVAKSEEASVFINKVLEDTFADMTNYSAAGKRLGMP